jgi:hypothetical protein
MSSTRELFCQIAAVLFRAALDQRVPDSLTSDVMGELPLRIETDEKGGQLVRELWQQDVVTRCVCRTSATC